MREPAYLKILARHFDALGPFLKFFPEAVHGVVKILFELLQLLPVSDKVMVNHSFISYSFMEIVLHVFINCLTGPMTGSFA